MTTGEWRTSSHPYGLSPSQRPRAPCSDGKPVAIGLALTLIHLISIPVTNTSVNPARSTAPAIFVGEWALSQLWMFWIAPLLGAALAGLIYPRLAGEKAEVETKAPAA